MSKKLTKTENIENVEKLKSLCTKECNKETAENLKKFYMNRYGSYMTSRIISTILIEFLIILIIMQTGMDSLWEGIPYADTIIYGVLWGAGGLYLAQMVVRVVFATYDLKLALEAGKVKKSDCEITLHSQMSDKGDKNIIQLYVKANKKNELVILNPSKLRKIDMNNNIAGYDGAGTKLMMYVVDDKRNDIFLMVKDRPIGNAVDKVIGSTISDNLTMQKVKLMIAKDKLKKK